MKQTVSLKEAQEASFTDSIVMRRVSDVKAEPIDWLWKNRIARGKVSIIAGDPGLGKSQLTALMASVVTNGARWPVDSSPCPKGSVIFLSAEDDVADTIRPRLEAVGADLDKVYIFDAIRETDETGKPLERSFNLKTDIQKLGLALQKYKDVALIIIDPISAYFGGIDSHKNADMRALLSPLSDLAAKHKAAIVGITHLNKGQSKQALQRITGSGAIVAAARAAYIVIKDPEQHERRMLLPIKNNIGDDKTGFSFSIEPHTISNGIETSRLRFDEKHITEMADDILASEHDDGEQTALEEAMDFLKDTVGQLGLNPKTIERHARDAGISSRTLRRAKDKLGIKSIKEGTSWVWKFPESREDVQHVHQNNVDTLATLDNFNQQEDLEERIAIQQYDGGAHA